MFIPGKKRLSVHTQKTILKSLKLISSNYVKQIKGPSSVTVVTNFFMINTNSLKFQLYLSAQPPDCLKIVKVNPNPRVRYLSVFVCTWFDTGVENEPVVKWPSQIVKLGGIHKTIFIYFQVDKIKVTLAVIIAFSIRTISNYWMGYKSSI